MHGESRTPCDTLKKNSIKAGQDFAVNSSSSSHVKTILSNVEKTINHPPVITIYIYIHIWYKRFPAMRGLWHCFTPIIPVEKTQRPEQLIHLRADLPRFHRTSVCGDLTVSLQQNVFSTDKNTSNHIVNYISNVFLIIWYIYIQNQDKSFSSWLPTPTLSP